MSDDFHGSWWYIKEGLHSLKRLTNLHVYHDSIFYPKDGVSYAMEKLWEDADEGVIDFIELSNRLQQIADWISAVEKSISAQPEWVGYY